jgi:HSP20 family molecular chaperone IbpA
VEADKVEAKYRSGVLELRFPKIELPKPRKIAAQNA